MKKIFFLVVLFMLPVLLVAFAASQNTSFPQGRLTIKTASGERVFNIELALSEGQQQRGLMYRKQLASGQGMLFVFPQLGDVKMWMKNTYIPLDMLFIDKSGKIIYIAENTKPESEETISSGGQVKAVLELAGGTSGQSGIKTGDMVIYKAFAQ